MIELAVAALLLGAPEQAAPPSPEAAPKATPASQAPPSSPPGIREDKTSPAAAPEGKASGQNPTQTPSPSPGAQAQDPWGSFLSSMLVPLGFFFVIFYFLLIRPQKRQAEERRKMLQSLQKKDEVETSSGIIAVVSKVKDQEVVLLIDPQHDVKVRVLKSTITNIRKRGPEEPEENSGGPKSDVE